MPVRIIPLLLTILLLGCASRAPQRAEPATATPGLATHPSLFVLDFDAVKLTTGSGFFVAPDGRFVTCRHVVQAGQPLGVLMPDGTRARVVGVVGEDEVHDLAVLRVEAPDAPQLTPSHRRPIVGEQVWTLTRLGRHSALVKAWSEDPEVDEVFVFAAPALREGASGGAVVDAAGELVGVVRGAVDDDPEQVVAVPAGAVGALVDAPLE